VAAVAGNLVGTTDGTPGFIDGTADLAVEKYYYRVTAVNASGEGIASNEIELPIVVPVVQSPCLLPGLTLAVDATGDSNVPGSDLISLNVAEPQELDGKLLVQIKADDPANAPPGTMFAMLFHTPDQPASNPNDTFVGMVMEADGPHYVYGQRSEQVIGIAVVQTYSVTDELPEGSSIGDDGTINLVVPHATIGLERGDRLTVISMNSHTLATSSGEHIVRSNNTLDTAESSQAYTLREAGLCLPNTAPLARLVATPASGTSPLMVMLDGSGSSDDEDAIVEYTFNPGDGGDVIAQAGSSLSHTYSTPGNYRATLSVKDARGLASVGVAQAIIEVKAADGGGGGGTPPVITPPPGTPAAGEGGRFGGGAFGSALVLLGLAALARRRHQLRR
jgi:hypothetical protein